jgi:hypothetical protein
MRQAAERLQQAMQQAGAAMYQGASTTDSGMGEQGGPSSSDEDVVEGEFSDAP